MKATVLVENYTSRSDLTPEYGLSIHLGSGGSSVLMDTGQKDALFSNAPLLGIDLAKVNHIILSHGHFDHAGGLGRLLLKVEKPHLWAHRNIDDAHMRVKNNTRFFIGCHFNRESVKYHTIEGKAEIAEDIFALEIPLEDRDPDFVNTPKHLVVPLEDGRLETDPFRDDISLVVKGDHGLSVILGCAHAGVVNILEKASAVFGTREFHAVMGGMHLGDAPENYVEKVTAALAERFRVQLWRPCHCTGIHAAWRLASKAGNVEWAGVGTTLDL